MSWLDGLAHRLRVHLRPGTYAREREEEARFHKEMETVELGAKASGAQRRGRLDPADLTPMQDKLPWIQRLADRLHQDLGYAIRGLVRTPGFTVMVLLTLALGIGSTAAIFSVVDSVMLRPLPFPGADRIVVPQSTRLGTDQRWNVSYSDFRMWRDRHVFEHVGIYQIPQLDLTGAGGEPLRATLAIVSDGFFPALGVTPVLGRLLGPGDFQPGQERPLVISYGLWQRRFGSAANVIGKSVQVSGVPVTIVGVLPEGAAWPRDADLWYPMRAEPSADQQSWDNYVYYAVGRLAPGASVEATRAKLAVLAAGVARDNPKQRQHISSTVTPLRESEVGAAASRALWTLLGAVGLVLLIGCVNVANLILARGTARHREMAVRAALGAGRVRILRQSLTESVVIAIAGGALGVALAFGGVRALVALAPGDLPWVAETRVDVTMLLFALVVSMVSALAFGLGPSWRAAAADPAGALHEGGARAGRGRAARRVRSLLVSGQLALSLLLLVGAGLLGRSFVRLAGVDLGFQPDHVVTFQLVLPRVRYATRADIQRFWDRLSARLEAIRDVRAASTASALPVDGGGFYLGRSLIVDGAPEPPAGSEVRVMWNWVSPGYFATLGQPLLAGRDFTAQDDTTAQPVIIVDRTLAAQLFPGVPPGQVLGRRVRSWRDENIPRVIVGVVGDVHYEGAGSAAGALVYVPAAADPLSSQAVLLRVRGVPAGLERIVRGAVWSLDPTLALAGFQTMTHVVADSMARPKFNAFLMSVFAGLALALAVVGVYGVLSYGVTQRSREIGVRLALGASPAGVLSLIIRSTLLIAGAGALAGVGAALALSWLIRSLLFGVAPGDPLTLAVMTGVLLVAALAAAAVPAIRAARVDPVRALRED